MNSIITVFWFSFAFVSSVAFYMIAVVIRFATFLFDRRLKALHLFTSFWAALYTWIIPGWKVSFEGREKIRKDATYMVVANHQSQLDILLAFRLFFHYKWVSKAEIFRVPLIGWNMVLNRYIKILRGDKNSIADMKARCEKTLAEGSSLFFFPEGTRSRDGRVKDFKPGAFELAKKMMVPILVIVISGTAAALPKNTARFSGTTRMILRVAEEVPYERFKDLTVEETGNLVRDIIIKNLDEMNSVTGA